MNPLLEQRIGEAYSAHHAGRTDVAERQYRALLADYPRQVDVLYLLSSLLLHTQPGTAAELAQQGLDAASGAGGLGVTQAALHDHYASCLYLSGAAGPATEARHLGLAHRLDGGTASRLLRLADAQRRAGWPAAALATLEDYLAGRPGDADALANLGALQLQCGQVAASETTLQQVLATDPAHFGALTNLGNTFRSAGRSVEAANCFERALALRPQTPDLRYLLGRTCEDRGRPADAASHYEAALAMAPEHADAAFCLANIHDRQGRPDAAIAGFERAIASRPGFAEALANLGAVLGAQERFAEALDRYQQALALRPDLIGVRCNLGSLLLRTGHPTGALKAILDVADDSIDADLQVLFCQCLGSAQLAELAPATLDRVQHLTQRALTEHWTRPVELVRPVLTLIRRHPEWRRRIDAAMAAGNAPAETGAAGWRPIADQALLLLLLAATPVASLELERFLTATRQAMLAFAGSTPLAATAADLTCFAALAGQCFINEYAFALTPGERAGAQDLRAALVKAMAHGQAPAAACLAVGAAYFPLGELPAPERLLDHPWPPAIGDLLRQQIAEPQEEARLRGTLPCLTPIDDDTSTAVREQYEENPYPRWVDAPREKPLDSLAAFLRRRFPHANLPASIATDRLAILIAGCGTGQHPIALARAFPTARVLAIDLSRSSLGYALRKARQLDVPNLSLAQADILQLDRLDESFDLIESVGVLHHLADPMLGWRTLLKRLRPGGFMCLGFYSALARRDVVAIRDFIAEGGYGRAADDIRSCRQDLLSTLSGRRRDNLLLSADFFSLSGCRDLLFHVQEHHLTLPQIGSFLAEHDLDLLGFDLSPASTRAYRQRFPDDPAMTNLVNWHRFETDRPSTFGGMYQFWVRKPH